ncbi:MULTISPECIES: class I SAM-dependent methyltransferase [unclassified Pseudoalteromonas]|uniref:class I SAM-dependent methyltransferase n=1 Tax=unclassified Pseudoalteromonas TaxID=194690 RepID=UPI000C068D98|nr:MULTISPECIES: class I SAM-dependent methyltransferase [unclassified Pseudoalteromonas]MDP2636389.1 class I SAM-dependent methyltransferase [Pseudoalteromonas sp. 1_MG-2023]PHN88330.1 hypothetical protein CSC79_18620 [Pseudoalteromonas sp. 3D05]
MYLNPKWRILTVGDGDLSFSYALFNAIKPSTLVASTYDSKKTLCDKYSDNAFELLEKAAVSVLTQFDVTCQSDWQRLGEQKFDLVIFQFPLIPAFKSEHVFKSQTQSTSANTLNRALLHQFIKNACQFALDKAGAQLCYITSKDVKPYLHWNIEGSLVQNLDAHYLGQMNFDITQFPGYKIRNVDRDKHVKDTSGITYVFSPEQNNALCNVFSYPSYLTKNHCGLCRAGPFCFDEDKQKHFKAKKHQQMLKLEADWQQWLTQFYKRDNA